MRSYFLFLIISLSLFLASCEEQGRETQMTSNADKPTTAINNAFSLMQSNCFSCHSPDPSAKAKFAPLLADVKGAYLKDNKSKEVFIKNMSAYLLNPDASTSKMKAAIHTYGLKPKMNFSEENFKLIAEYIYDCCFDKKGWYENKCSQENYGKNTAEELPPLEKGLRLAMQTKAELGKKLMWAIKNLGTENALLLCSSKAYPITDSMAKLLNTKIKRVSDKNRNPKNAANGAEYDFIKKSKILITKGEKPKSKLSETADSYIAWYPIVIEPMCLQCHGKEKTEILPQTLKKIKKLYPRDKARNYKAGDLRGMWVIEFKK